MLDYFDIVPAKNSDTVVVTKLANRYKGTCF